MEEVGLMPPPEGVIPNFHMETDLQRTLKLVYSITFAIATILLILRFYTGMFIVGRLSFDAPLMFLSWGVSLAFFICMLAAMPAGFGKHMWDVTAVQLQGYLKLLLALAMTYIWPPTLAKLSIVWLYYRINPKMGFPYCLHIVGFSIFAYTVVFTALFAGPCNPNAVGSGVCLNNIAVAQAVLNIFTDAVLIAIPIPMVHSLNMPIKTKITVGVILALGSAVVIVSIVRVSYVQAMQNNPDVTYTQASAAVWSCLELNVGIICSCLATLKPFVRTHMPWLASIVGGITSSGGTGDPSGHGKSSGMGGSKSGSNFNPFRGDRANHSYQLHSVDRSKAPPADSEHGGGRGGANGMKGGSNIVVTEDFRIRYHQRKTEATDTSSAEDILIGDEERGYGKR